MADLYVDINSNYTADYSSNILCTGAQALLNSLINLINTIKDENGISERLFKPYLGTGLYRLLFEPIDSITAYKIRIYIDQLVEQEPRVMLVNNETSIIEDIENQCYYITLTIIDKATQEKASSNLILSKP